MQDQRCPYFSVTSEKVSIDDRGYTLRAPVYQCGATSAMIERLEGIDKAQEILDIFAECAPSGGADHRFGPDLEPISCRSCKCERYQNSCRKAFRELVQTYDPDSAASEFALKP